jgi:hypothetical protein
MKMNDFETGMRLLDDRFKGGKQSPSSATMIYWDALQYIPYEPWEAIITKIVRGMRQYPTPDEINQLWGDWYREHPELHAKEKVKAYCPDCGGDGWFNYKKQVKELGNAWYSCFQAKCARCKNYDTHKYMRVITRQQLISEGAIILEPVGPNPYAIKNKQALVNRAFPD